MHAGSISAALVAPPTPIRLILSPTAGPSLPTFVTSTPRHDRLLAGYNVTQEARNEVRGIIEEILVEQERPQ